MGHLGQLAKVYCLALSPDGQYVLTGDIQDRAVMVWDLATGQQIKVFADQIALVRSVSFSPDGNSILAGLGNHIAYFWDLKSGQELREFISHTSAINSVAFSSDGKYILTGSADGTARLWDVDYHDTIRYACSLLWQDFSKDERTHYKFADHHATCPGN